MEHKKTVEITDEDMKIVDKFLSDPEIISVVESFGKEISRIAVEKYPQEATPLMVALVSSMLTQDFFAIYNDVVEIKMIASIPEITKEHLVELDKAQLQIAEKFGLNATAISTLLAKFLHLTAQQRVVMWHKMIVQKMTEENLLKQ